MEAYDVNAMVGRGARFSGFIWNGWSAVSCERRGDVFAARLGGPRGGWRGGRGEGWTGSYRGVEGSHGVVVLAECGVGEEEDAADGNAVFGGERDPMFAGGLVGVCGVYGHRSALREVRFCDFEALISRLQ